MTTETIVPFRFLAMQEDDIEKVHRIEASAYTHGWSESLFRQSLKHNRCILMTHQNSSQILGYAIIQKILDECHILNICISKQYQSKGLGSELLSHIIDEAKREKCAHCFLEVRASNQTAIALYDKFLFNEIGIRKNYYPTKKGREDAIQMSLTFSEINFQNSTI